MKISRLLAGITLSLTLAAVSFGGVSLTVSPSLTGYVGDVFNLAGTESGYTETSGAFSAPGADTLMNTGWNTADVSFAAAGVYTVTFTAYEYYNTSVPVYGYVPYYYTYSCGWSTCTGVNYYYEFLGYYTTSTTYVTESADATITVSDYAVPENDVTTLGLMAMSVTGFAWMRRKRM